MTGTAPGVFGLQTGVVMATFLCPDGGREGPLGGSTLECKCLEVKQGLGDPVPHHGASHRSRGEEQGPAPAPQNNILVFTLDIEKPLNGKETCALPRRHASRRPARTERLLFGAGV